MLVFAPVHSFGRPASLAGIYSEDDYLGDITQRAAQEYAFAHARVQSIERERQAHFFPQSGRSHRGPEHAFHPYHPAQAPVHAFHRGFGPSLTGRRSYPTPASRRTSFDELANLIWQEEERQRAISRQREAISRQREAAYARQREVLRQRALAEALAREQQAYAARAARIQAQQARDQQLLQGLLSQLGLAVSSHGPAPPFRRVQPSVLATPAPGPAATPVPASVEHAPIDLKGKGRAVDVPTPSPAPILKPSPVPPKLPTFKEELEARIRTETDPEVQESLLLLYSDIFDVREPAQPVAGPSGTKHVSFEIPVTDPASTVSPAPVSEAVKTEEKVRAPASPSHAPAETESKAGTPAERSEGAGLHRSPALPPAVAEKLLAYYHARRARKLSLAHIASVEDALRELEAAFEFPVQLDFSPSRPASSSEHGTTASPSEDGLAYTANNTPVHAYEHALNALLARLDAVESNGDEAVRGRRREVVHEVERALHDMERRIEESRERSREREREQEKARERRASVSSDASVTVTPYNVHEADSVDNAEVAVPSEDSESRETKVDVKVEAEAQLAEAATEAAGPEAIETDAPKDSIAANVGAAEDLNETLVSAEEEPKPAALSEIVDPLFVSTPSAGLPNSGADTNTPSPHDESMHGDPSSPVDDSSDDIDRALDALSPPCEGSPQPSASALIAEEDAAVPSRDYDLIEHTDTASDGAYGQFEVVSEDISPEHAKDVSAPVPAPALLFSAPESISRNESIASEATFVTAEPDSAADDATFFTAGTATPAEPEANIPVARSDSHSSSSSAGEETFLLSSTPLAEEEPKQRRLSSGDDELEIISADELEAARNDDDCSDVESHSDL